LLSKPLVIFLNVYQIRRFAALTFVKIDIDDGADILRINYFTKLINNIKIFYIIEQGLNKLTDGRVNPTYKTSQVIFPLLIGFLLRIKSMNELNYMLKEEEFKNILPKGTKVPQVDTMRDVVKLIDLIGLYNILRLIIRKAI